MLILHRSGSRRAGALAVLLMAMLSLPCRMSAQPDAGLIISAGAGYEASWVDYTPTTIDSCNCSDRAMSGLFEASVWHIGLEIPGMFGLRGRLDLAESRITRGFDYTLSNVQLLLEGNILPVEQVVEMKTRFGMTDARLELLGTYAAPFGLSVGLGPYVGYRNLHDFEKTETLIEPEDARFRYAGPLGVSRNNGRQQLLDDGRYQYVRHYSLGALLTLSWPIALYGGLGITPELRGRLDLISPFVYGSLGMRGLEAGLSLFYALPSSGSLSAIDSPEPASFLSAAVAIRAVAPDGARLREATVRSGVAELTRHVLLLPTLRFDESSDLPARYIRLGPGETGGFSIDSIARLDPSLIDGNIANIFGARLREDSMRVRLVASVRAGESAGAAELRGASLRRYLSETWGIDGHRIAIATEPGDARLVRVELGKSPTLDLTARWSEPRAETSPVRIEPEVESSAGVRSWSLRILRDGRELARQEDGDPASRINIGMLLGELREDAWHGPLVAELTVEDSSGRRSTARDTLGFRFEESGPSSTVEEYLLFGVRATEDLEGRIAAAAGAGSHVAITPLSEEGAARKAASDLASRLEGSGAELMAPPSGVVSLEGIRITIEKPSLARP